MFSCCMSSNRKTNSTLLLMPSFESFENYVIISCYPLKPLQRYYIFFIWQNVFHSFLFSLPFSSFILFSLPPLFFLLFSFSSFPLFLFSSFPFFLASPFFLLPSSFIFQYNIIDCACMCVPAHICECTYVYYKEQFDIKRRKVFKTVKFETKMKLSS